MTEIVKSFKLVCALMIFSLLSSCYGPVGGSSIREEAEKNGLYDFSDRNEGWLDNADQIDPSIGLNREDYNDVFRTRREVQLQEELTPLQLPDLANLVKQPEKPIIEDDRLVTLSVTDDVPLKDVLIELARRADVDMEIDPQISGGVIFSTKDKPFSQVIERLTKLAGLRYSLEGGVLRVERDTPYVVNYGMNILNTVRSHTSSIGTSESELGTSTTELTVGNDNGDLWAVVESGVTNILSQLSGGGGSEAGGESGSGTGLISLNRQAGVISIMATRAQHVEVKEFLDYIHVSASSQVLIEAKVVEVTLNDQYRSGIKWDLFNNNITGGSVKSNFASGATGNSLFEAGADSFLVNVLPAELLGWEGTSLDLSVELLEEFGVTRSLSSPRISTMNNQFAVLNFTENLTYFTITIEQETEDSTTGGSGTSTLTIDSEENTVQLGVSLTIQPSIDLSRNEIILNVRPRLTREVAGKAVADPSVTLTAASIASSTSDATLASQISAISSVIPRISTRELDTVMRISSGAVMVIGGLMEERTVNIDQGVPGVSKIPFIGNAFKSVKKDSTMVETVIFIKATIVPGRGVSIADRNFYNKFTTDREPLSF